MPSPATGLAGLIALAAVSTTARPAVAAGDYCPTGTVDPTDRFMPANLPALVYTPPAGGWNPADAEMELTELGVGPLPFTVEPSGGRFLLRLGRQPRPESWVILKHTQPCGANRLRLESSWSVLKAGPFPTTLGKVEVVAAQAGAPDVALLRVVVTPSDTLLPFLGTTRFTITVRRAGMVLARITDQSLPKDIPTNPVGELAVPCGAADSGPVELEAVATVAGAVGPAAENLVARSTWPLSCPQKLWDGGTPVPPLEAGVPPTAPHADASDPSAGDPTVDAGTATAPPPPSSGCTLAATGTAPWWAALAALAAVVRLRRPRR